MKKFDLEIAVGLFVVLGFVCFAYLSVKLGDVNLFGNHKYQVKAYFGSVAGLKEGAPIKVAGVPVGNVKSIRLDEKFYEAEVALELEQKVKLPRDSIASVRTSGIIGDVTLVSLREGVWRILVTAAKLKKLSQRSTWKT